MALQKICIFPQHKSELRKISEPVCKFHIKVQHLIQDLNDTLKAYPEGIGLAASQINKHLRVIVVCLGDDSTGEWQAGPPVTMVNPLILDSSDKRKDFDGCLSFPGLYGETVRPHFLRLEGLDAGGCSMDQIFEGLNAVVIHHEVDHLDGILFIDRVEKINDLYRVKENEQGEWVRIPFEF
jgi:peptide deformylase